MMLTKDQGPIVTRKPRPSSRRREEKREEKENMPNLDTHTDTHTYRHKNVIEALRGAYRHGSCVGLPQAPNSQLLAPSKGTCDDSVFRTVNKVRSQPEHSPPGWLGVRGGGLVRQHNPRCCQTPAGYVRRSGSIAAGVPS